MFKYKSQPFFAVFPFVDPVRAEHQQVNADCTIVEANQEVLAPAIEGSHFLVLYALQINVGGTGYRAYRFSLQLKGLHTFFQDNNRGTFGHKSIR